MSETPLEAMKERKVWTLGVAAAVAMAAVALLVGGLASVHRSPARRMVASRATGANSGAQLAGPEPPAVKGIRTVSAATGFRPAQDRRLRGKHSARPAQAAQAPRRRWLFKRRQTTLPRASGSVVVRGILPRRPTPPAANSGGGAPAHTERRNPGEHGGERGHGGDRGETAAVG